MTTQQDQRGTFACHICGLDTPHTHTGLYLRIEQLTRELAEANALADSEGTRAVDYLRRARKAEKQIAELTQPAPLALSAKDAQAWESHVEQQRDWLDAHPGAPTAVAIIAVDALLRKRVTPLTDEQILRILSDYTPYYFNDWTQAHCFRFARAVEKAHQITGDANG